ncbi:MAG: extracellular solute-binding protein, partial [Lachnospiraceae bacterium]
MKKKALALLMATAMVATMAGCGNGTNAPANTDTSSAAGTTTNESTPADTSAETKDVALTVWAPSEDQAEGNNWLATMCEQFNEAHPEWNITFTYGVCAEGDAKATVTQDVEAAADVYMFANDNLTDLIAANGIAKLGGSTLEYVQNNMSQALVDSVTIDGSVYGVPFTTNTWFMYYNKSVLSEDDVKSLETMLEKGKVAFPLSNSWYIASFYAANGCTLFGDGTDEAAGIDFGGDKAVAVTNYLVDLAANPNFVNDGAGEGLAGLADGSVVAMFSGSWDYANVVKAIGEENVGAAELPTIHIDGEDKSLKAFFGSKAIGVNPNCDDMEVAVALAAYLGGEEAQKAHYEMRNILPTNTTVLADPAIASDV